MLLFQRAFGRDAVLPPMVRHLVPAGSTRAHGIRIKLADSPRREDRRLDVVTCKQFEKAPDADPPAELPLGKLQRRLIEQASKQHWVEIGRDVDAKGSAGGPAAMLDHLIAGSVAAGRRTQSLQFLIEIGHLRPL